VDDPRFFVSPHTRQPRRLSLSLHGHSFARILRTPHVRSCFTAPCPVPAQIVFTYSKGNSRGDHALMHYGWPGDREDDPHLCCVDEPGGDLWNCPDPGAGVVSKVGSMTEKGE